MSGAGGSSCCGRGCASLSQKWKWLLRDPGRAPDYSSCSNKASASELRLIQVSWYTLAALWWPGWGDRGQRHEDHTHWPPSVCSALEVPVLYPVHVGPEGPPECPPPLPGGNLTARVAPSGRGELCQSSVVYVRCSRLLFPHSVCFLSLLNVIISSFSSSCVFLSLSMIILCIYSPFYSVWFCLVYSLLPMFLLVSALPCHALPCFSILNTVILSYIIPLVSMHLYFTPYNWWDIYSRVCICLCLYFNVCYYCWWAHQSKFQTTKVFGNK